MMIKGQSNSKVSILIPLFNQERYFKSCIKSVEKQTYKNLEIIIVNDGSTDRSTQMAHDWAARDNRVKVIDKSNEGVTMARRDGLLNATGQFVAFVDSDDMLPPRAIETLVDCINETGVDLVLGAVSQKIGFLNRSHLDKKLTFPCHHRIKQPELFDKYFIGFYRNNLFPVSMWGRLYRKSIIDIAMSETQLFDQEISRMGEDQYFNLMLFPFLRSMYRTDQTVYIYRYGGLTSRFNPHFTQLFVSSDKRLKMLDRYNYTEGFQPLFAEYVACLYHNATQLIHYNMADKNGVIDFFKEEIEHRELMPRLLHYYTENGAPDRRAQLLLDRDFEGMYQCACDLIQERRVTLKSKIRSWVIKSLMRCS